MSTAIIEPKPDQLEQKALSLPEQAKAIRIVDQATYERAGNLLLDVAAMRKQIVEYHAPLKKKAHEAHRAICDAEAQMLRPVVEAEQLLNRGVATYTAEQRRKEEEARRQAALEAQREAERQRAAAALEAQRLQQEAEQQRLAAALEAEQSGAGNEVVDAILEQPAAVTATEVIAAFEQPVFTAPVRVEPTIRTVAGLSQRDNWKWEVVNANEIPREYLKVDEVKIGGIVRAMKGTTNIPGIRVWNEPSAIARTKGR